MSGECCNGGVFHYYVGEKSALGGYVRSVVDGEIVVVTSARYKVTDELTEEIVAEGPCEINGERWRVLLQFTKTGNYIFKVYLKVSDEEPVETAHIIVEK